MDKLTTLGKHFDDSILELDGDRTPEKKIKCNERGITDLPNEMVVKILSNLNDPKDIVACKGVNRSWRELINAVDLEALTFYRSCHPPGCFPDLYTPDHYRSSIKDWLEGFGSEGEKSIKQLEPFLKHKCFSATLFFSMAQVLAKAKAFHCKPVITIPHSNWVNSARFSPDGTQIVTVSSDSTAKICGLVNGEWQEKATINHSHRVNKARFSPDGTLIVTASRRWYCQNPRAC